MKPSEPEIENLLRRAPKPAPPPELKQQLLNQMSLASTTTAPRFSSFDSVPLDWWRRWWPALAPAAVSVACAVVITVQQTEIRHLREGNRSLPRTSATETTPLITPAAFENAVTKPEPAPIEQEEIARLKERVKQLTAEITQLELTQQENESLKRQIAAPTTLSQEEMDALAKAREKAMSIQCINNLKYLGLAARQWAIQNNNIFPPDVLSMINELDTPKLLVCPADTNRPVAASWASFSVANCSYEHLAPSASSENPEPYRVLSRCPIHGHVGFCDGAVQGSIAKIHPDWLIEQDGKVFYRDPRVPPNSNQ